MTRDRNAISLGIASLIVIALIIVVGFGVYLYDTFITTSTISNDVGTTYTSFPQFTTFTTVTRTTLSFGGSTYLTTTGEYSGCIPPIQCYLTTVTTEINGNTSLSSTSTTSASAQQQTSSSSQCTVHAYGIIGLTIVNSSSAKPLSGLPVEVSETSPCGKYNLGSMITDSNGTIMTQGLGSLSFGIKYDGLQYIVTGQAGPMSLTCITLYVPSDRVVNSSSTMSSPSPNYC
jgi:hypothetical protein